MVSLSTAKHTFKTILNNKALKRKKSQRLQGKNFGAILNNIVLKLNCQSFNSLIFWNYSKQHGAKTT